jgi:GYF domain 2
MSNRAWFYASEGQQHGPYPETQLREFIARGAVRADTLVWTEGMANWQKAAEIPDLFSAASGPPAVPYPGGLPTSTGGHGGGSLSIDFGIWEFVWRSLVFLIGIIFVIPVPWALVWYMNWTISRIHVPGRPNLAFTGTALTAAAWYFGAIVLAIVLALTGIDWLNNLTFIVQFVLYWLAIKWVVANLASNGQNLGLSFSGSIWAYLGWNILMVLSIFTIIGWAWVYAAQMRWFCRNIQGTRREASFNGTGLEFLWRFIVAGLASMFIIPIPWTYRWIARWMASQTVLVERGRLANP